MKGFFESKSLHRWKAKVVKFMKQISTGSQSTQCPWTAHIASNQSAAMLGRSMTIHLPSFHNFSLGILFYPSSWSGPAQLFLCSLFNNWLSWIFIQHICTFLGAYPIIMSLCLKTSWKTLQKVCQNRNKIWMNTAWSAFQNKIKHKTSVKSL